MSAPNQVSFLPDDYLRMKKQRRANALCASLTVVVLVAIVGAFIVSEKRKKLADDDLAAVNLRYARAAKPIEQFRMLQDKQKLMNAQAALAASLLERVPRSFLLAQVTNALPKGAGLMEFNMDSKLRAASAPQPHPIGLPPSAQAGAGNEVVKIAGAKAPVPDAPPAKAYDITLRITGVARNDVEVAAFINGLQNLSDGNASLLRDVNLVVTEEFELDKHVLRKFEIEAALNAEAQIKADAISVKPPAPFADAW